MLNKLIYGLFVLLIGYTTFLFFQNKLLTEKIYEVVAMNDYKSLSYLSALDNNKSLELRQMLMADISSLILHYNKDIYLTNDLLKNICKDIHTIKGLWGNDINMTGVKIIEADCNKIKPTTSHKGDML